MVHSNTELFPFNRSPLYWNLWGRYTIIIPVLGTNNKAINNPELIEYTTEQCALANQQYKLQ
jgi:hypothetical protein